MSEFVAVARVGELSSGEIKAIEVAGVEMILVRDGDSYFALARYCLHQRTGLDDGIVIGGHVVCPLHAWRYKLDTGALEMQPETCLGTYSVRVSGLNVEVSVERT